MKVNLLPDLVLQRRRDEKIKRMAAVALVVWCGLFVLASLGALGYRQFESAALASANQKETSVNAQVNSADNVKFRAQALEVQNSLTDLDQLLSNQQKMSNIISQLAAITPKTVVLSDVSLGQNNTVSITGTATSYLEAGKFESALKNSQSDNSNIYFTAVSLGGASLSDSGVKFSLNATYTYSNPGGQS